MMKKCLYFVNAQFCISMYINNLDGSACLLECSANSFFYASVTIQLCMVLYLRFIVKSWKLYFVDRIWSLHFWKKEVEPYIYEKHLLRRKRKNWYINRTNFISYGFLSKYDV